MRVMFFGAPTWSGRRGKRRKFAAKRRISAGGIHFRRGFQNQKGSREACPVGNGMTDPFAVERYKELFIPMGWTVK